MWLFLALGVLAISAQAQIRIVSFNTLGNPRTGSQTVLTALGDESVNGIAKAPDIFSLSLLYLVVQATVVPEPEAIGLLALGFSLTLLERCRTFC